MYGLKPVPFKLIPVSFELMPVSFELKRTPFNAEIPQQTRMERGGGLRSIRLRLNFAAAQLHLSLHTNVRKII